MAVRAQTMRRSAAVAGTVLLTTLVALAPASTASKHVHGRGKSGQAPAPRLAPVAAAHRVAVGFNEDWHVKPEAALSYASAAGGNILRFPVGWQEVQPEGPETWNWDRYDELFGRAAARGMQIIFAPADTPCWAHPSIGCPGPDGGRPPDPEFLPQWGEFLRRAAERYSNLAAIEVWNEPNASPFWATRPDPRFYAQLLRVSYDAVKSVRPDLPVLFGGLAPAPKADPSRIGFRVFLRRAYAAGAAGHFDALSLHPYPHPFSRPDYVRQIRWMLGRVRAIASRHGDRRTPIWVTEVGVSTSGPGGVTEGGQGRRLAGIYRLLRHTPRVPVIVFHRMFDQAGTGTAEDGWGLIRADGTPKPAWCALARVLGHPC